MYKVITIWFFLTGIAASCFSQAKDFEVQGDIENYVGPNLSLTIWDGSSEVRYKSIPISEGKFSFKDTTSIPLMIRATPSSKSLSKRVQRGSYPVKSQSIWFIAQPGEVIKLTGKLTDFSEVYPSGNKENEMLANLTKAYFPLTNQAVNIKVRQAMDSTLTPAQKKALTTEMNSIDDASLKVLKKGVTGNPSSLMALWFANDMMLRSQLSIDEAAAMLKKVDKKYHETPFYQAVSRRVSAGKYVVGAQMFDIKSGITNKGLELTTADLKGKFYLMDFWGTWCGPCMSGMPGLKVLKAKLAGKLEILGIDQGDSEESWKKAIVSSGLNWLHLRNGKGENDFVSRLNITGYPTKILVSPEGKILYRATGENEGFSKTIEKMVNAYNFPK